MSGDTTLVAEVINNTVVITGNPQNVLVESNSAIPTLEVVSKGPKGDRGEAGPVGIGFSPPVRVTVPAGQSTEIDSVRIYPEQWNFRGAYENGADYTYDEVVSYYGNFYYRSGNPNNPGYPPSPGSVNASWTPITDASIVKTCKWMVTAYNPVAGTYKTSEVLAFHNGVEAHHSNYGMLGDLTSYTVHVAITNGFLVLYAINDSSDDLIVDAIRFGTFAA